jgi:signal transduction histidine kinase/ActR/RegA family two-component response regulator
VTITQTGIEEGPDGATPARPLVQRVFSSFRARLLVLILLIVIPALGMALYSNFERRRLEGERIRERALALSKLAATKEENFIRDTKQLLETLTQFPFLLLSTNESFSETHLANLKKLSPDYASFGLIETNGMVFCSSEAVRTQVNLGDRRYFRRALETKQFSIGEFQVGRLSGESVVNFGQPVFNDRHELQRVLFASLKLSKLSEALTHLHVSAGGAIMVLDGDGTVLARSSQADKWIGRNVAGRPAIQRILQGGGQSIETEEDRATARLYAATVIAEGRRSSLFVIAELPLKELFAEADKALAVNIAVLGVIGIGLWCVIHVYARRFFLKPVEGLGRIANELALGNFNARAGTFNASRELVQLGNALDRMAGKVQERTAELEAANGALRAQILERDRAEQQIKEQQLAKSKLEEQFLRSQRMESVGALAGGVAHDLNNALVPVVMGSEMLRQADASEADRTRMLDLIGSGAKRCSEMVKQILSFARGTRGKTGAVPIRHLVLEMAKIAANTFPKSILVETSVSKEVWTVDADATELHQVLMNLCVNARDAMPSGGKLWIAAENVTVAADSSQITPRMAAGRYVLLRVRDTGTGIPPELQSRIFEPFFTTKAADKGTGLGLSTVATLVKRYNGHIELKSEAGKGTEFEIYLPASSTAEANKPTPDSALLPCGKGELILLADDEQMVLELAKRTLETYGYRVVVAANGMEAIARFEMRKHDINLVVTDTDMPFLDGLSAARAIRKISPRVPIIVASATVGEGSSCAALSPVLLLHKPYGIEQLLQAAAAVLKGVSSDTISRHGHTAEN